MAHPVPLPALDRRQGGSASRRRARRRTRPSRSCAGCRRPGAAYAKRFGCRVAEMAAVGRRQGRRPAHAGPCPRPATGRGSSWSAWGRRSSRPRRTCAGPPGAGVRQAASMAETARPVGRRRARRRRARAVQAVAEGALLGSYRYAPISTGDDRRRGSIATITVVHAGSDPGGDGWSAAPRRRPAAVVQAREWVNIAAQPALSGVVRRRGPAWSRTRAVSRRGAGREGAGPGWVRRHPGRRRRLVAAAAAGPAELRARGAPSTTWRWSARASRSTPAG